MKLCHLKKRSVINIYNGNFMGYITDIIVSLPNGNIESLIVQQNFIKRLFCFISYKNKIIISWSNIVSIGKDVILVNIVDN